MNNKEYLDKVVDHMVRYTEISDKGINPNFKPIDIYIPIFKYGNYKTHLWDIHSKVNNYLKTTFGLTEGEIVYVWNIYKDIILKENIIMIQKLSKKYPNRYDIDKL